MFLYFLSILVGLIGLNAILVPFIRNLFSRSWKNELARLDEVILNLREFEEVLGSGLIPEDSRWVRLDRLSWPWGDLVGSSLRTLREQGGAIIPTLKRLRELATEQQRNLQMAASRTASVRGQAMVSFALIPVFGLLLYYFLPGVEKMQLRWVVFCAIAFLWNSIGILWLKSMIQKARWAGLPVGKRNWLIEIPIWVERMRTLLATGSPHDLAWSKSLEMLETNSPELIPWIGSSVWKAPAGPNGGGITEVLFRSAVDLRKAVQVSLLEGRGCLDRIDSAAHALALGIRGELERELSLLGNRALKPLFVCTASAVLGLMFAGFFSCFQEMMDGGVF